MESVDQSYLLGARRKSTSTSLARSGCLFTFSAFSNLPWQEDCDPNTRKELSLF